MSVMDIEERLEEQISQLRTRASQLRGQAADLEAEANRLERDLKAKPVEHVTIKPVERGKEISLKELDKAMDALEQLQPCSSSALAEHLAISQTRAVSILNRLKQLGNAVSVGISSGTRWSVGDGTAESSPSHFLQDYRIPVRDAGRKLGTFTPSQVHEIVPQASRNSVARWCRYWVEQGVFERGERSGDFEEYPYTFVPPEANSVARPRRETPENEVRRFGIPRARGEAVAGTGRDATLRAHSDVVEQVTAAGGSVSMGKKHLKLFDKDGRLVTTRTRGKDNTRTPQGRAQGKKYAK